jgi:O-antigen/teichoic acid export membrane protein
MIKTILKDSYVYGVLNAFNRFFMFLIFFLFVKFFQKEDIAILDMLIVFSSMVGIFISMQLESSFARFYFNEKEHNNHFDHMRTIAYLMGLFWIIYLIPSYFIFQALFEQYSIENYGYIFGMIFFIGILLNITNLINLHFRYSYEKKNFIIASLLFPISYLIIIGVTILVTDSLNIFMVFLAQVIAYGIALLYQFRVVGIELLRSTFQSKNLKDIFKYSLPMFPMFFLIFANDKAIIYILKEFISLDLLADFSVATKYLAFLSLFFFALRMALEPKINRFVSFPSDAGKVEYVKYINIYIVFSVVLLLLFMVVVPFVQNYFFDEYKNAYKWATILALSLILLHMSSYMTLGFGIKKRMDIKLIIVLFQVIFNFVGFYLVLENHYGVVLALNYLVLVNYVFMLVQHYYSNRLYKVSNEYLKATGVFLVLFTIVNKDFIL